MFQNAQSLSGNKRSFSEIVDVYMEPHHVEQENIDPQLLHRSTTSSGQSSKEICKRNQNLVTRAATIQYELSALTQEINRKQTLLLQDRPPFNNNAELDAIVTAQVELRQSISQLLQEKQNLQAEQYDNFQQQQLCKIDDSVKKNHAVARYNVKGQTSLVTAFKTLQTLPQAKNPAPQIKVQKLVFTADIRTFFEKPSADKAPRVLQPRT